MPDQPSSSAQSDRIALVIGLLVLGVLMLLLTTWSASPNDDAPLMTGEAAGELARSLPWVLAWLLAAFGVGRPVLARLMPKTERPGAIQLGLGIALILWLVSLLGRLGLLQLGGGIGAWLVLIIGWCFAIEQAARWWRASAERDLTLPHWLTWTAVPASAVLIIAALSAPGWLWRTEFGGYDVMGYHLQLPAEWLALGRIAPLEHNVYSFLPNLTEAAYYHLAVLIGDAVHASTACQLLHASFALVTAWLIARFATPLAGRVAGAASAAIFLGTPWIIVTGSLAYNEMAVTMMLALGLCVLRERVEQPWRIGAMIGMIAATACGAKLSALGFAAIPLGVLLLWRVPRRGWMSAIVAGTICGLIVLAPWLIDNMRTSGNPVFPFATSIFSSGHWNEQQIETWNEAHFGSVSIAERAVEVWHQFGRYGIGQSPYAPGEPWLPQWSILPWLLIAGVAIAIARRSTRAWGWRLLAVVVLQFLFWLSFTHVKARFMIPVAVPAAIVVGVVPAWLGSLATRAAAVRLVYLALAVGLIVWCALPAAIFRDEGGGAPAARLGFARILTGEALRPTERQALGAQTIPAVYLNYQLPQDSRVLFVGEAAPLYYRTRFTYNTTWDRGPLSVIMRDHPDNSAAWIDSLRERGFTHVLVNPIMLDIWDRSGWNDPLLRSDAIVPALEGHSQRINAWPSGERLYRLR